jgi:hypothetical protein
MAPTSAQYVNAACDLGAPLSLSFLSRSSAANNSMWWQICRRPIDREEEEYGWFAWDQQEIRLTAGEDGAG